MTADPALCQAEVMKKEWIDPKKGGPQHWVARQCRNARSIPGVDFCTHHLNLYRHGHRVKKVSK